MAEQKRINERLIALVCLGIVAFNYPFLSLFNKKVFFGGVPLLYLYIFSLWLLFVIVLALIIRKRSSAPAAPTITPGKGHS